MIIDKPWLCTRLEVWHPKYSTKWHDEPVVMLHKSKVHHATSTIIIEFTKAKSLIGQRYAITRDTAQACPEGSNRKDGKLNMFVVPMSRFESWESKQELNERTRKFIDSWV